MRRPSQPDWQALDQWSIGEILPIHFWEVEDAVDNRALGHLLWRRAADSETLLEPGEGRLVTVVRHHLAVEQETPGALGRHCGADLGVGRGEILAGTRLKSHVAAHFACDTALTVELALQEPIVAEIATVGQRG
jgi:hypothetical protein